MDQIIKWLWIPSLVVGIVWLCLSIQALNDAPKKEDVDEHCLDVLFGLIGLVYSTLPVAYGGVGLFMFVKSFLI